MANCVPLDREGSRIIQENRDICKSFEIENDLMRGYLLKAAERRLDQGFAQHGGGPERILLKIFIRIGELSVTAQYENNWTI